MYNENMLERILGLCIRQAGFNEFFIHGPPLPSVRGLCGIDSVYGEFEVTQKNFKNLGSLSMEELNRYSSNGKI